MSGSFRGLGGDAGAGECPVLRTRVVDDRGELPVDAAPRRVDEERVRGQRELERREEVAILAHGPVAGHVDVPVAVERLDAAGTRGEHEQGGALHSASAVTANAFVHESWSSVTVPCSSPSANARSN